MSMHRKGLKARKHRAWCQAYRLRHQRERNKARKLKTHLARFPDDRCAQGALARAQSVI